MEATFLLKCSLWNEESFLIWKKVLSLNLIKISTGCDLTRLIVNWWGKNWYSTTARDISNTFLSCGVPYRALPKPNTTSGYTIESSSSFSRWGEGGSALAKEPLRILASFFFFFCEIIDLGSTRKNELAQHPVMILTMLYALLLPGTCLVSHHTRSGALKHGHQEWLPRHIKSSYKIVLVCGKSLEIFGPGLWTCSSLR